jgi:hypothetical protein
VLNLAEGARLRSPERGGVCSSGPKVRRPDDEVCDEVCDEGPETTPAPRPVSVICSPLLFIGARCIPCDTVLPL